MSVTIDGFELKNCPFCGSLKLAFRGLYRSQSVDCQDCGASGASFSDDESHNIVVDGKSPMEQNDSQLRRAREIKKKLIIENKRKAAAAWNKRFHIDIEKIRAESTAKQF